MRTNCILFYAMSLMMLVFTACSSDNGNLSTQTGSFTVKLTDSPVDDARVQGVFVTIADVKVDGQSLEGFNKTTVDLFAYQNGNTFTLIQTDLEASSYNSITFELDFTTDAQGNAPGCYVRDEDGAKHPLASGSVSINKTHEINIEPGVKVEIVVDFDLRKAVQRGQGDGSGFEFVGHVELNNAVRVVDKQRAGKIAGNCDSQDTNSDLVIVYAYNRGAFNRSTELQGSSESNLMFHNAVTSSKVGSQGNYELHFLQEGRYELHFASYERNPSSGRLEFKGTLLLNVLGALDLNSLLVNATSTTTVNVAATGVMPF